MNQLRTRCPHPAPCPARRASRGFLLIEVLVSILIFSVGVLALIGLQAKMTTAQTSAKFRADAGYLANEVVGIMWGDVSNLTRYNGVACASYARCDDWQDKVAASLPGGAGAVAINATTRVITVTVSWTQASEGQHTFTTTTNIAAAE